jgi:hypothetical protein
LRAKAQHSSLARPFGGHVAKAGYAHSARESPLDCGLDEIGSEKGE